MYRSLWLLAIFILLGGMPLAPAAADDAGVCASAAGDEAMAACSRIIESGQTTGRELAVIYRHRGVALRIKGDYDRAIADFDAAIRLDPQYVSALAQRGVAWRQKGDLDRALADLDAAIKLDSKNAFAYFHRAYAWGVKGERDRAIADYSEAIRLNPKDTSAFNNRGLQWKAKGDLDRAFADFNEAIRLNPKYSLAYTSRGSAWKDKGDVDRAIADHNDAIRLDPKNTSAYNNRGIAWKDKGDLDRAIADFTEAIRLDPKYVTALANRGIAWRNKGDLDRSLADLDAAIKLDSKYAFAYFNRAFTWGVKGERDRAIADYSEAIRLDPKDAYAFNNRGLQWKTKGDLDRALSDYDEAIRLNPKFASPYNNRGVIWRMKRDFDRAVADYNEALRHDPNLSPAITGRGLAYESKGERERARADFEKALALPPKGESGKWAQDTARARLALLAPVAPAAKTPSAVAPAPSPATSTDRIALVIGNGAYVNAPQLPNPPNDARAIGRALRAIGFTVIDGTDLDHSGMERTIVDFLRKASLARVAVVFYAGHGVQIDGKNYLVPIDAKSMARSTVTFELIDVDRILTSLDDEARANVIILDACRDNPLETRLATRSAARGSGLAGYSTVASGMLIAFATAPGMTAADGAGQNSPFTTALVKHIGTPGLEINQMLTRVRVDVVAATSRQQIPWVNSSLLGEVVLTEGTPGAAPAITPTAKPAAFGTSPVAPPSSPPIAALPPPKSAAASVGPTRVGQFGEWESFVANNAQGKICYALARPKKSQTGASQPSPGKNFIMISQRPAERIRNEVSILMGYEFKSNSEATVEIGANKFAMYTKGNGAWVKGSADEARFIETMRTTRELMVKGTPAQGPPSVDNYSLDGFAPALDRTLQECK